MRAYSSFVKLLHLYSMDVIDRDHLENIAETLLSQEEGLMVGAQLII